MSELFLKIINMSISASWLVLAVLVFRLVFKKAPKWIHVLLWGIVAVRLLCPFSIESALSLIPSAETISPGIMMSREPTIHTGVPAINSVVNPIITETFAPEPVASANPLQIWIPVLAMIWGIGVALLLTYTAVSYWRLRKRVRTAVLLRDNIFQSEAVSSPFVLGIIKPKIYLPYEMDEQDLEHVVAHEQAHIRRRDHWWKPFGFLLLTIHWFNPLMWLAYILLSRDIELACDEKVIQDLGNEQRADYSRALLACSINRRMIAACPLAFGEVGVKERVKSVMNYKKPAFWVIAVSVIACVVVAVCFLTNPRAEREFPINGENVADLDTNLVVEKIAEAERLEDGSQLCVNADNFDLMFTPDFNWANDGAIRFFYGKNQKVYSAQLRMFHNENKYFVTERSEWIEQDRIFNLGHYLDALKYIPQEEVRQLSPDADGYSVMHVDYGEPSDFERVLTYSQEGVTDLEGWFIHLTVQPLHKVEGGAYNGSGDEVIHLFYGQQNAAVEQKVLSLNDVIILSQKGHDLTWSDFDQYKYIETGSGLYIRIYEIDEQFGLMIGGAPDRTPMYIYLCVSGSDDTRIDIRDGGVEEFITKDYSAVRLNRAIYDAILDHNKPDMPDGLYHCASFVLLALEETSGTPLVGVTNYMETVTVYGLVLHQAYGFSGATFHEVMGSHIPVAITFELVDGKYRLQEYWEPRDGSYYVMDIRDKFPDEVEEDAMNTQKYIAAQKQECLEQAKRYMGVSDSNPDQ